MLKLVPRHHFVKIEAVYGTGQKARSFSRWSDLRHLIFMQHAGHRQSESAGRYIQPGCPRQGLYHLGIGQADPFNI
jgi:hypothetical protein